MDPEGFAWGASQAAATLAAIRADCVAHDGADPLDEAAELMLKQHGLRGGARLWLDDDAGFALVRGNTLDLAVAPVRRGEGRGESLASAAIADPGATQAWSHGDHPAARRLAASHGFTRVRELWMMRRSTTEPLPALTLPNAVRIRSFQAGDQQSILAVNATAFASHPEQGGLDADDLAARMAQSWFDPQGLLLAESHDTLLGFHWTKQQSAELGEVYVVAVAPQAQGSGLGRALTLAGLHHLTAAGVREIVLYVESDNGPAVAVYTRLGFTHANRDTHVMYARPGIDRAG